ncbi:MAG: Abortive infection protein [Myxococcales bacterium]|nr:Abortive infection protein [Myxococcales bacterium]
MTRRTGSNRRVAEPRAAIARSAHPRDTDVGTSLVLIFPLLLAYEIGVLFAGRVNGADVVTRALYTIVGSRTIYLLVHACVAAMFLLWIRHHRRWGTLRVEVVAPVVLEASIYALTLGAVITLILDRLLGLGAGDSIISALGAGVHEELVFRLGMLGGIVALLRGIDRRVSLTLALFISSLLFAAAHHAGSNGEPFTAHAFAFRTLAGAAFGAIFWFRSLAHAVYAHVLYDLVVAAS